MRFSQRLYNTGLGELMCLVLAWTIGGAALWADYLGRTAKPDADRVAASGKAPAASADFE